MTSLIFLYYQILVGKNGFIALVYSIPFTGIGDELGVCFREKGWRAGLRTL